MPVTETPLTIPVFPISIAYGTTMSVEHKTAVFEAMSGKEQRNVLWANGRVSGDVATGIQTEADLNKLVALFRNVKGRAYPFAIRDWSDYKLENQQIGVGDGTTTDYQIIKTYDDGISSYTRDIRVIEPGSITQINVGAVVDTNFNVDLNTGIVSFAVAPPAGDAVVIPSGRFFVKCRFNTDKLQIQLEAFKL